ncbi:MAG: LysR family transcriptional regulator [Gemmobacter sp.]
MSILAKEVFSFIEILSSQSVRKAAERLNISASALSRQLRLLEADLGVALVARHSSGIRATAQGEQLLAHAERMIELENGLRDEVRATGPKGRVELRIGVMECIGAELVRGLNRGLGGIGDRHGLTIIVDGTDALIARLVEGSLDGVVAFNMPTDERIRLVASFDLPIGLVCSAELFDRLPTSIALADCLVWPLCLPSSALSSHHRLMAEIHRQDRAFTIAATSNSLATLCGLIADGGGVGLMSRLDVIGHRHAERLRFVPLKDRRLTERLGFATSMVAARSLELAAVLELVGRITSEIAQEAAPLTPPLPGSGFRTT